MLFPNITCPSLRKINPSSYPEIVLLFTTFKLMPPTFVAFTLRMKASPVVRPASPITSPLVIFALAVNKMFVATASNCAPNGVQKLVLVGNILLLDVCDSIQ